MEVIPTTSMCRKKELCARGMVRAMPVWNGGGAIGAIGQEEAEHAKVILDSPVIRCWLPVVELADQSYCL